MIALLIGPPGSGKTTILNELTYRHGTPHFELSWMPEFLRMNGKSIDYAVDEAIAIDALIAVAKTYIERGHRVVFISDFRLETLPLVYTQLIDIPHKVVRLICSDANILSTRVLNADRPSGYRNVEEALRANEAYASMQADEHIVIDVAGASIDDVIRIIEDRVIMPDKAMTAD